LSCFFLSFNRAPNFWFKGLKKVWGDPNLVTASDALRFQWPSIGKGWERGLLAFTRSRISSTCAYKGGEYQLLNDVLKLPNVKLVIVHGSKDPVIPIKMSKQIMENFGNDYDITFIELEGQGHDPFEERIEEFIEKVVENIVT